MCQAGRQAGHALSFLMIASTDELKKTIIASLASTTHLSGECHVRQVAFTRWHLLAAVGTHEGQAGNHGHACWLSMVAALYTGTQQTRRNL